jgi:hypothetical protein
MIAPFIEPRRRRKAFQPRRYAFTSRFFPIGLEVGRHYSATSSTTCVERAILPAGVARDDHSGPAVPAGTDIRAARSRRMAIRIWCTPSASPLSAADLSASRCATTSLVMSRNA